MAFLVHVSSRDARICTAKPHGTVQQCLCGVDPPAAFHFLQPLRQSDDDFRMRKMSPFSNLFVVLTGQYVLIWKTWIKCVVLLFLASIHSFPKC